MCMKLHPLDSDPSLPQSPAALNSWNKSSTGSWGGWGRSHFHIMQQSAHIRPQIYILKMINICNLLQLLHTAPLTMKLYSSFPFLMSASLLENLLKTNHGKFLKKHSDAEAFRREDASVNTVSVWSAASCRSQSSHHTSLSLRWDEERTNLLVNISPADHLNSSAAVENFQKSILKPLNVEGHSVHE